MSWGGRTTAISSHPIAAPFIMRWASPLPPKFLPENWSRTWVMKRRTEQQRKILDARRRVLVLLIFKFNYCHVRKGTFLFLWRWSPRSHTTRNRYSYFIRASTHAWVWSDDVIVAGLPSHTQVHNGQSFFWKKEMMCTRCTTATNVAHHGFYLIKSLEMKRSKTTFFAWGRRHRYRLVTGGGGRWWLAPRRPFLNNNGGKNYVANALKIDLKVFVPKKKKDQRFQENIRAHSRITGKHL